jgi:hypothetical protein
VSALIAVDCIWSHRHRTSLFEARCSFFLRQVSPALSLTEPFPTMLIVKHRLLTAEQFHIAAAHLLLLLFHDIPPYAHVYALFGHPFITSVRLFV